MLTCGSPQPLFWKQDILFSTDLRITHALLVLRPTFLLHPVITITHQRQLPKQEVGILFFKLAKKKNPKKLYDREKQLKVDVIQIV